MSEMVSQKIRLQSFILETLNYLDFGTWYWKQYLCELRELFLQKNLALMDSKVINVGSDTFGNPIFQKILQNQQ